MRFRVTAGLIAALYVGSGFSRISDVGSAFSTTGALAKVVSRISVTAFAAQSPSTPTLLQLAARYVGSFAGRFSLMVAEEHYVQDWKTNTGITLLHRETKADFALKRRADNEPWVAFRDVFEVNGTPVRDRDDRLAKLFLESSDDVMARATAIRDESARYNISNVQRTVNQPLFVLIFLQDENQRHFSFSAAGTDRAIGPNVRILEYKETAKPTLIRGTKDSDLPARGRVWLDDQGTVLKTELILEDNLQSSTITSTFRYDAGFKTQVPSEMIEQYNVKGNAGKVSARATYGSLRHWEVRTEGQMKTDK